MHMLMKVLYEWYSELYAGCSTHVSSLMCVSVPATTKAATTAAATVKTTGTPTVLLFHADSWCIIAKGGYVEG